MLGTIIMIGREVERVRSEGIQGKKCNYTNRMDELFPNDIHWLCMTAARSRSRMEESKGALLMADKGDYHLQKVGFTSPRGERVQVTHQQKVVGFLYGLLTSTKSGTCVPSLFKLKE